jgi:hypothetical protein
MTKRGVQCRRHIPLPAGDATIAAWDQATGEMTEVRAERPRHRETRYLLGLQAQRAIHAMARGFLNLNKVSDDTYFADCPIGLRSRRRRRCARCRNRLSSGPWSSARARAKFSERCRILTSRGGRLKPLAADSRHAAQTDWLGLTWSGLT